MLYYNNSYYMKTIMFHNFICTVSNVIKKNLSEDK